jgi:hypothetical protein
MPGDGLQHNEENEIMHDDRLDIALREAIHAYANIGVTDPEPITVPPEVMAALTPPEPEDDVDALIDSVGARWPVQVVSWTEAVQ